MAADDRDWVRRTVEGDSEAFDHIMQKYMARAYALAFRMVNEPQDAEDITQDAFLKAYRSLRTFRGDSSFYTWFCRILINLCRDHLRKRRLRGRFVTLFREENQDEPSKNIESTVPDPHWSSNPAQVLEKAELGESIKNALESLSIRQRSIFVLKHFQDLQIGEISKVLKISEGTVKTHLFRAVQTLRKALNEPGGGGS